MKNTSKDICRLSTIAVLVASLGTVGFSSMQDAWAMPGVIQTVNPGLIPPGGDATATETGNMNNVPHLDGQLYVVHRFNGDLSTNSEGQFDTSQNTCDFQITSGDRIWALYETTNNDHNMFEIENVGDSISAQFPTVALSVAGSGTTGFEESQANTFWQNVAAGPAADTLETGIYLFHVCVIDTLSGGILFASADDDAFTVEEPVGGEILSINTTSLILAGLTAGFSWIAPAVATIAGTAIVAYKLRK